MKMPEAAVTLVGQVLFTEPTFNYVDGSKIADGGQKVAVLGVGGATQVKLKAEHAQRFAAIPGDQVAWQIQPAPYSVEGNSGVTFNFVAPTDMTVLDAIHNVVAGVPQPEKQKQ